MFNNLTSKRVLRTAGLCLAVAGVIALPQAGAQTVTTSAPDSAVVVRDAATGQLRAATPQENNALKQGAASKTNSLRAAAPAPLLKKYHRSGATGARLTEEFLSSAVVKRAADGSLVHECVDAAGHASHATEAARPASKLIKE
jgi:hypothetical protein